MSTPALPQAPKVGCQASNAADQLSHPYFTKRFQQALVANVIRHGPLLSKLRSGILVNEDVENPVHQAVLGGANLILQTCPADLEGIPIETLSLALRTMLDTGIIYPEEELALIREVDAMYELVLDPTYYEGVLGEFLAAVRLSRTVKKYNHGNPREFVEKLNEIVKGMDTDAELTVRSPEELLGTTHHSDADILANGYLTKGGKLSICGPGGVGKSRFVMQLATSCILGRAFLGWGVTATATRWLIIQTENSNRRLQADVRAMLTGLSDGDRARVNRNLLIHTLEAEHDSLLTVSVPANVTKISSLITKSNPDVVVFDVLRDFAAGDLNTDEGMTQTLSALSKISKVGNPQRAILVVHHSLSGKAGAAKATGYDRGSFSRNSKVLTGWVRSQINLIPHGKDNNETLIVASGKCNDAPEFPPFGIALSQTTKQYAVDETVDIASWESFAAGRTSSPTATTNDPEVLLPLVPGCASVPKNTVIQGAQKMGIGENRARRMIAVLISEGKLVETLGKRSGTNEARFLSLPVEEP